MTSGEQMRRDYHLPDRLPGENVPSPCQTHAQSSGDGWELPDRLSEFTHPAGLLHAAYLAWPEEHKCPPSCCLRSPFPNCSVRDLLLLAWDGARGAKWTPEFLSVWGAGVLRLLQCTPEEIEAEIVLWALGREG